MGDSPRRCCRRASNDSDNFDPEFYHPDIAASYSGRGQHRSRCPCGRRNLKTICIVLLLLIGAGIGIGLGIFLRTVHPFDSPKENVRYMTYLYFPAELLMRFMAFVTTPLIASGLISGLASVDAVTSGKILLRTLVYYFCITVVAVGEGMAFVYAIRPGRITDRSTIPLPGNGTVIEKVDVLSGFLDMVRNIFPDNLHSIYQTQFDESALHHAILGNKTYDVEPHPQPGASLMPVIFLSLLGGLALASLGDKGKPLANAVSTICDVIIIVVSAALWCYPLAVICILMTLVIWLENPVDLMTSYGMFLLTIGAGLVIHCLVVMPLVFLVATRCNPFRLMCWVSKALITAIASGSSTLTLPVALESLESRLPHQVARVVVPIGAALNLTGAALCGVVGTVFIADLRDLHMGAVQIVIMALSAIVLSLLSCPGGGALVLLTILFQTTGIPLQDVLVLIIIDWILCRVRTLMNIWGDCVGVAVVAHLSRHALREKYYDVNDDDEAADAMSRDDMPPPRFNMINGSPGSPSSKRSETQSYTLTMHNEDGDVMKVSKV